MKSNRTLVVALLAVVCGVGAAPQPENLKVKYYGRFSELPVGAVQPHGWIQKWLERQASGLTGHPENLSYPYDTCLYTGNIPSPPYTNRWWSPWWPYEQAGYFVDGLTRLSWLVNDPSIRQRRDANLDYILNHSTNGNLGPSRWCWPNAVVGRALMAQFSATGDARLTQALQRALLANAGAITNRNAKEIFYHYRDGANFEQAFYLYGLSGDRRLLEIGRQVCDNYLHNTNSFCSVENIESEVPFHEHGVTAAETLKCFPLTFLYTGDERVLRLARRAYQKVVDHSLMPDGGFVSAEYLGPAAFDSLHESCDITDWPWSLGYLFMATGDGQWADLVERATFNALPGAVTKDFKQLQYFSAVNQVVIALTNRATPHNPTRMAYRAAHDTECCTGNINRAMPNYVTRMWMRSADGGLAAVHYGPCEVTATVGRQSVTVTEETDYPFRDSVRLRVKTKRPVSFALHCRIPQWCTNATIQVNGQPLRATPPSGTFVPIRRRFRDGDIVNLKLPMPVRVESWFSNQAVCVTRGPLVYSLKIAERRVEHATDPEDVKPLLRGHDIRGFPAVEFYPESDWRYATPATTTIKVVESAMTDNPFVADDAPIRLEMPLYRLPGWSPTNQTDAVPRLPATDELKVERVPVMMTLVPYGATHLRLTTLPVVETPRLIDDSVQSRFLGGTRAIHVYLPASYDKEPIRRYPVLYLHDGQNVFSSAGMNIAFGWGNWALDTTVDRLCREGKMEEIIMVAVDNGAARYDEYCGRTNLTTNDMPNTAFENYAAFLMAELKPKIDREYRTRTGAAETGVIGSSMGGICSVVLAWQHPEVFGKAASLSGWFGAEGTNFLHNVLSKYNGRPKPIRVYLDSGVKDFMGGDDGCALTTQVAAELTRIGWTSELCHFVDARLLTPAELEAAGLRRDKWPEAQRSQHNEFYWRLRAWRALTFLFPAPSR
jgi:predicted alpha/beta superfamily hydrolase